VIAGKPEKRPGSGRELNVGISIIVFSPTSSVTELLIKAATAPPR
jgi:hypothetical protein